ncbi:hypothetical protein LOB55_08815, partial [Lactobacillus delbrueckii subsp. lactis]|uniref:hypothetical protein n=1 Tax=Lactobacillus delbrueckii TaxID=1584 RepID=UPI001E58B8B2
HQKLGLPLVEVHTTERTRHFLVKKPKKILQLRLEDKNVFNAIHLNSIGYVFEFGIIIGRRRCLSFFIRRKKK